MRIVVPVLSWLICIPFSLFFAFAWGMSGFGPAHSMLQAPSYLWVAVPVLIVGAILLLLKVKRLTWLSFVLHVLPWNAFPWLSLALYVPAGNSGPWIELGKLLFLPSLLGCGTVVAIERWPLPLPKQVQRVWQILGIGIVAAICAAAGYQLYSQSENQRKFLERTERVNLDLNERLTPVPPDPAKGPQKEAEWRYLGAIPKYGGSPHDEPTELSFGGLGSCASSQSIEAIERLESLTRLDLEGQWVTDRDLQHVKHLRGLKQLALINTSITDAGLQGLAGLGDLEVLNLTGSPITDESLATFLTFPKLQRVVIYRTKITADGRQSFAWKQNEVGRRIKLQ
jgi:hypothetical protein